MPIVTLVTPKPNLDFDMWIKKSYPNIAINDRHVLDDNAVQWVTHNTLSKDALDSIRREFHIDIFQTIDKPNIKLFMADMDSTIVKGETLDDMAELAGIGAQIATITRHAMRGELNFEEALNERVQLLKGQPASLIDRALEAIELNPGAQQLLDHLQSKNIYCVLISGGFTQFTAHIAQKLGFDAHFGNELIIQDDLFTGNVKCPILDKNFKLQKLQDLQKSMNLSANNIMAIGDGANDLSMLQAAGHGIAYHGKPLLQDNIINQINYTNLNSLIYLV